MTDVEISLNCLVQGEFPPRDRIFDVSVCSSYKVSVLRALIKKVLDEEPKFRDIPSRSLTLWKVCIPIAEDQGEDFNQAIGNLKLEHDATRGVEKLVPTSAISRYFPEGPYPDCLDIYVVPLDEPSRGEKRKASEDISHELYKKQLQKLPCPSDLAKGWTQSEEKPVFLNHRPLSATGLPTELLHPVFGRFLDDCLQGVITPEAFRFAQSISNEMSAFFESERSRCDAFRRIFNDYYGIALHRLGVGSMATSDGTWVPDSIGAFIAMNLEVKKESGTSGDSHIQNVGYFQQYLLRYLDDDSLRMTRLPCFLLELEGPYFSISGAFYGEKIIVDPYYSLSLACPYHRLESNARIFYALKNAVESLHSYYSRPQRILAKQRQFPYPTSFCTSDGKNARFSYSRSLQSRFTFIVDVIEDPGNLPKQLFVKFVRQYPKSVHEECATLGIAPKLFGYETLPGGWSMVVMEYLGDHRTMPTGRLIDFNLKSKLERAVSEMHRLGYVHGDLRDVNILVNGPSASGAKLTRVMFIDWDWAGMEGEVKYPISLNPDVPRHPNAKAGGNIEKTHDQFMLNMLFEEPRSHGAGVDDKRLS